MLGALRWTGRRRKRRPRANGCNHGATYSEAVCLEVAGRAMIEFCARSPLRAPRCKSFSRNCSRLPPAWAPAAHDQKTRILPPPATAAQSRSSARCIFGDTPISEAAVARGGCGIRVRSAATDQLRSAAPVACSNVIAFKAKVSDFAGQALERATA